jgi:hypothetical protein
MSTVATLLPVFAAACGAGAGADYSQAYATLHGSIASSSVKTTSEVRVALVWQRVSVQSAAAGLRSVQELGLRAQFPASFQMQINALPPSEALSSIDAAKAAKAGIDPNLHLAAGTLVVYEDSNGNGKLDLLSINASSTIDRVLGVPQGLTLLYVEGTPPSPAAKGYFSGLTLQRGFNLLQEPGWQSGNRLTVSTAWSLLPLSTEIPIVLTAAPQLSQYVCQNDPGLINECAVSTGPFMGNPSVPAPTLPPNCDLSSPAAGAPASGSAPGDPVSTPPPLGGDKTKGDGSGASSGSNGSGSNGGGAAASPPGTNGAGQVNCGPGSAATPCSQSACMFNPAGAAMPPSSGPAASAATTDSPGSGQPDGGITPPCCKM